MIKKNIILLILLSTLVSCSFIKPHLKNDKDIADKNAAVIKNEITEIKSRSYLIDGIKYKMLEDDSSATVAFLKALQLNPKNDAALYELAQISLRNNDIALALSYIEKASEIAPNNKWYRLLQAQILVLKKNYNGALKIYNKLIEEYPHNVEYLYEQARIYLLMGNYNRAVEIYDNIEKLIGVNEQVSFQKENIYLIMNKPLKAVEELQKLVNEYPDVANYRNMIGDLYIQLGKYDEALKEFVKVKDIDALDPDVDFYISELYLYKGNIDSSFAYLKKAFANPFANIDKKVFTAIAYINVPLSDTTSLKKVDELVNILVKTHPDDAKAHSVYADFLYKINKKVEARDRYRYVIQLDSSRYLVWEQLLNIEMELKDYTAMADEGIKTVELFPEQPIPYLLTGFAYFQLKNYNKAADILKSGLNYVVSSSPLKGQFYSLLADAYYYSGDYDNAFSTFEKAIEIEPENATLLNNYAYYLSLRNINLDKARQMAEKANKIKPETATFQDTYAWVFYKMGDYEKAKLWLEKAISNGGDKDPDILEHYGDVLYKLSDITQAVKYWEKAKDYGNNSELLVKKIKDSKLYE